jgi:type III restriction enzyme
VLCSVAELSSPTAVEQILGRVLRMPKARRKTRDALNRAYAFVASNSFQTVAERLKDGLVDGAGFDRLEAEQLVKPHGTFEFDDEQAGFVHQSDAFPDSASATAEAIGAAIARLPPSLKARLQFDPETREIGVHRPLSRDERNAMHLAFAKVEGAERVIDRLFIKSNRIQASELPEGEKPPFLVPRLGIHRQGVLELFGPDHFLDLPWNLAECDPGPFASRFTIHELTKTGEIDVSDRGHIQIAFVGQLHDQLALAIQEPAWTMPRLVNWIDRGIVHPDVTKPAAKVFIERALANLASLKGYTLDQLARYKYELRRALTEEIQALRTQREQLKFNDLFAMDAGAFETSAELAILFDEQSYAYNQPYKGTRTFNKHYFPIIGDLKPDGEEFRCAVFLDEHPAVRFWVRNVDRKPNAFWLQLSGGRFYPDFVAMLNDGRTLVVEYKGQHLADSAAEKRTIGELWAEASNGQCIFAMPVAGDFSGIEQAI